MRIALPKSQLPEITPNKKLTIGKKSVITESNINADLKLALPQTHYQEIQENFWLFSKIFLKFILFHLVYFTLIDLNKMNK